MLAQLVQSAALTGRRSAVRARYVLQFYFSSRCYLLEILICNTNKAFWPITALFYQN